MVVVSLLSLHTQPSLADILVVSWSMSRHNTRIPESEAKCQTASFAMPALEAFVPEAPALPAPGSLFPPSGWSDPSAIPGKTEAVGFTDAQVSEFSFTPDIEPEAFAEAAGALVKVVANRVWSPEDSARFAGQIEPSMLKYAMENFPNGRWDGKMTAIITLVKKP